MSWAKLDDRFHENRKVRGLWRRQPAALGLHVMALTYCAGHETDGFVDNEFVEDKVAQSTTRRKLTAALCEAGMWVVEDSGWRIHDYLDFHPSKAELDEKRRADRRRKQASGRNGKPTESKRNPDGIQAESGRNPAGFQAASESPVPSRPVKGADAPVEPSRLHDAAARLKADDVTAVFDAWITSTGRTNRTLLDDKRRRLIRRALQSYPLADVIAAVQGWQQSPHHRGENKTSTVFNDLELLLRDAKHIEMFRDLRTGTAASRNPSESVTDLVDRMNAAALRANGKTA
jgi:hypothetical protein